MSTGYQVLWAAIAAGTPFVMPMATEAAVITNATSYTTVSSIGVGQSLGTAGYFLPDTTTGTYSSYPSYVSTITGITNIANNGYAPITLHPNSSSSESLSSGAYYAGAQNGTPGHTMATITLTGTVPAFQLGIMTDNGNAANPTSFSVIDSNSGIGTTTESSTTAYDVDDFFLIDVSNASAGDVISIVGNGYRGGTYYAILGGLTFDPVPTPEPTSLALLPCLGLLGLRRRRQGILASPPSAKFNAV